MHMACSVPQQHLAPGDTVDVVFDFFDTTIEGLIVCVGVVLKSDAGDYLVWGESFFAVSVDEYLHVVSFALLLMIIYQYLVLYRHEEKEYI